MIILVKILIVTNQGAVYVLHYHYVLFVYIYLLNLYVVTDVRMLCLI